MHKLILIISILLINSQLLGENQSYKFNYISAVILKKDIGKNLNDGWYFSNGDNMDWADPQFNDSQWEQIKSGLFTQMPKDGFSGIGWFRNHIVIDSTLINQPLGFVIKQAGASEIYLDGKLIYKFGVVGKTRKEEERYYKRFPNPIKFKNGDTHLLAVRYSNHRTDFFNRSGFGAGFSIVIDDLFDLMEERDATVRNNSVKQFSLLAIAFVLAFFHLTLFFFDKKGKENLYYSIFLFLFGAFVFIRYQAAFIVQPSEYVNLLKLQIPIVLFTAMFGAFTIFSILNKNSSKYKVYFFLFLIVSIITYWGQSVVTEYLFYLCVISVFLRIAFVLFINNKRSIEGLVIIKVGYSIMLAGLLFRIMQIAGFADPIFEEGDSYILGILGFVVSMSIFIARHYSATKKNLEVKLVEVKQLSEKNILREREASELRIKRELLEADNKRKTDELEEARKLQLSMLPNQVPEFNDLDIAVYISTATEVGGDYYDFNLAQDHLSIAIGDATGHGTKAGIMVATIKGLFSAFVDDLTIDQLFKKSTATIKKMSLNRMLMSMSIVRIFDNHFTYCLAGMPPLYHYLANKKIVEEVSMQAMPLGAMKNFPYRVEKRDLASGDLIVLMSDGFPELKNDLGNMIDYPKTKEIIESLGEASAQEVIDKLVEEASNWMGNEAQDDDITFVVIKVK